MTVPAALSARYCLGFGEIPRTALLRAQASPVLLHLLNAPSSSQPDEDLVGHLRRRWIATMLSGFASQRQTIANTLGAESTMLSRNGLATAASLLDAITRGNTGNDSPGIDSFLATAVYLRACSHELAKSRARLGM